MVVQHNMQAMNSNRMLGITSKAMAKVTEKLASGYKVNRAADDAAGLAISEKMRKQIRGLTQASLNAQDGISAVQTAEGALGEVHDMIQRMNELAVKSANGTNSQEERDYIQLEVDKLTTEIDRVAETTKFNELYLLKGDSKHPSTSQELSISGTLAGVAKSGVNFDATTDKTEWTYKATLTNTDMLAKGTKDKLEISYLDKDGKAQTKKIEFTVDGGKNQAAADTDKAKVTANNIAKAINDDKDLSAIFTATAKDGVLTVKSVDDDGDPDRKSSKIEGVKFESERVTAATQKTVFAVGSATGDDAVIGGGDNSHVTSPARQERVYLDLTEGKQTTNATAGAAGINASTIAEGDGFEIGGVTYTYGSADNAATNTFNTVDGLNAILKDRGFEANLVLSGDIKYVSTDASSNPIAGSTHIDHKEWFLTSGQAGVADLAAAPTTTTIAATQWKDINGVALAAADYTTVTKAANLVDKIFEVNNFKVSLQVSKIADIPSEVSTLEFNLHVGAESADNNKIKVEIKAMDSVSIGLRASKKDKVDVSSEEAATKTIDQLNSALRNVSEQRSQLGATQNRLEHTITNLDNVVENTTSAESQIRDTDMASTMVKYANNQILAQAGQAMLAQSNQANQGVLSLLQ